MLAPHFPFNPYIKMLLDCWKDLLEDYDVDVTLCGEPVAHIFATDLYFRFLDSPFLVLTKLKHGVFLATAISVEVADCCLDEIAIRHEQGTRSIDLQHVLEEHADDDGSIRAVTWAILSRKLKPTESPCSTGTWFWKDGTCLNAPASPAGDDIVGGSRNPLTIDMLKSFCRAWKSLSAGTIALNIMDAVRAEITDKDPNNYSSLDDLNLLTRTYRYARYNYLQNNMLLQLSGDSYHQGVDSALANFASYYAFTAIKTGALSLKDPILFLSVKEDEQGRSSFIITTKSTAGKCIIFFLGDSPAEETILWGQTSLEEVIKVTQANNNVGEVCWRVLQRVMENAGFYVIHNALATTLMLKCFKINA